MDNDIAGFFRVIELIAVPKMDGEATLSVVNPDNRKAKDDKTASYKIYQTLGRMRYDMLLGGKLLASYIAHFDKRIVWIFDPLRNTYREIPLGAKIAFATHTVKGTETIHGQTTTHHEATYMTVPNIFMHLSYWLTTDGFVYQIHSVLPKRCDNVPGSLSMFWETLKMDRHRIARDMFEIPVSYRKDKDGIKGTDYTEVAGQRVPLKNNTVSSTPPKAAPVFNVGDLMKNTAAKSGRVRS